MQAWRTDFVTRPSPPCFAFFDHKKWNFSAVQAFGFRVSHHSHLKTGLRPGLVPLSGVRGPSALTFFVPPSTRNRNFKLERAGTASSVIHGFFIKILTLFYTLERSPRRISYIQGPRPGNSGGICFAFFSQKNRSCHQSDLAFYPSGHLKETVHSRNEGSTRAHSDPRTETLNSPTCRSPVVCIFWSRPSLAPPKGRASE